MLGLEDVDIEGNEEDTEAVLEDFSPPDSYTTEIAASCNMHANVAMLLLCTKALTFAVCSPLSRHAPLG